MSSTEEPTNEQGETTQQNDSTEPEAAADLTTEPQAESPEAQPEPEPAVEEEEEDDEEPDDGVPRVLVTGASGFIALHVTKRLLQDGRFRVRGSVRNKKKKEKIQPLLDLVPDAKYPLRLIQADLEKPESWKKAVKSCSYVFHLASPFPAPNQPATDEILTPPAVEGTLSVLRACAEAGTVKRVILTSSLAAISNGMDGIPGKPADYVYSESDWSDEATCAPYEKSKLRAERAAWDFVQKLDEDKKFELVVLNPGYVQGPTLSSASGDGSKAMCVPILSGQLPAIPDISFPCIDVRDVADAHIAAIEKPEAAGNRYLLTSATVNMREVARILAEEFKPQGYKIGTMSLPKPVLWVVKIFNNDAKAMYPYVGKTINFNNEKMVGELGISPRSAKDMVIDTAYSLIEVGVVKKTPGYLGHPSTRPAKEPEPAASSEPTGDEEDAGAKEPEDVGAKEPETSQPEDSGTKEPESSPPEDSTTPSDPEDSGAKEPETVTSEPEAKEPEPTGDPEPSQPEEQASEEAGKEESA